MTKLTCDLISRRVVLTKRINGLRMDGSAHAHDLYDFGLLGIKMDYTFDATDES